MRRLTLWAPPILYMLAIFHFSSEPDPLPVLTTHVWDKALHITEFGGLALLFCRAFAGEGVARLMAFVAAVIATSIYGATDEWHQLFVDGRASDVLDWLADTIGAAVGAVAYVVATWFRSSRD